MVNLFLQFFNAVVCCRALTRETTALNRDKGEDESVKSTCKFHYASALAHTLIGVLLAAGP